MIPTCDRHAWEQNPAAPHGHGWQCSTCGTATVGCLHCGHPVAEPQRTACTRCIDRGRRLVTDIQDDLARFPFTVLEAAGLRSTRYDMTGTSSTKDDARLPFGFDAITEDPHDARITAAKYPSTALDILRSWATLWAETRGEQLTHGHLDYLTARTTWAIENPDASDWHQYADEARDVRATVRRILGITPVPEGTPCPDCGSRTIREWRPRADHVWATENSRGWSHRTGTPTEGLSDVVRCTRCTRSWQTRAHLHVSALAAMSGMPRVRPEALLTFRQLVDAFAGRVDRQTIATWIHRRHLRPVLGPWPRSEKRAKTRPNGTTERLYRMVDVDVLACWLEAHREETEREELARAGA